MALELVTWNPRVGASGNDKYNLPGAKGVSGAVSAGGPTSFLAGPASVTPPTLTDIPSLSEINSLKGLNQIVAEHARQQAQIVSDGFGSFIATATPTYRSGGWINRVVRNPLTASTLPVLVNSVRAFWGRASSSMTGAPSGTGAGTLKIDAQILAQLRLALAYDGTFRPWRANALKMGRTNAVSASWQNNPNVGDVGWNTATTLARRRYAVTYYVPVDVTNTSFVSALRLTLSTFNHFGGTVTLQIRVLDRDTSGQNFGDAEGSNTLVGTATITSGAPINLTLDPAAVTALVARATTTRFLNILFTDAVEYATPYGGTAPSSAFIAWTSGNQPALNIDLA